MPLDIETFVLGALETNCYLLRSSGACAVVDPALCAEPVISFLEGTDIIPQQIWLTHGHGDHIGGVGALKEAFGDARVCCPVGDARMLGDPMANMSAPFGFALSAPAPEQLLEPGTALMLGETSWQILDTSGHTPGSVSFYCNTERVVLTGDALFAGSIGRTDIPGASAERLIQNIRDQLLVLPDETRVLPGHGPATTIGAERAGNPFLVGGRSNSKPGKWN